MIFRLLKTLSNLMLTYCTCASPATNDCQYHFSYLNGATGNFSSPGFPDSYPSLVRCCYYFDAAKYGGVEIKFDTFELEDKKEGDEACRYDFIDVYTVDSQNFKTFLNRFCGRKIPHTIISPLSKLEIQFVSDHWQNSAAGFSGRYRFLGTAVVFKDSSSSCCFSGRQGFPRSYMPQSNKWDNILHSNYQDTQLTLMGNRVETLNLREEPFHIMITKCTNASLRLYNGYATSMSVHTHEWCGKKAAYSHDELQYPTFSSRTVIRFISGPRQLSQHRGFKLLWMAFYIPNPPDVCTGFQCEGGQYCDNGVLCTSLPKYCISKHLVCDGVRNCGPFDDSDERKCTREILIMAACIAVPSLVLVMTVVLIVYCYKTRHVKKSASQDQPLANSHSQGTTSRESFILSHRQMMLHTSFIDGTGALTSDLDQQFNHDPNDIDQETTHGLFSDGATGSLRSHKKRPSYHMMQQKYEDGNLISA
ncbi:unnamed protein product [Candidula unifasciata]|uniref:CUB domain-containing protein n=1 Tax=Candidula unifasciata TaxID=100452 RepID=A0A8S3ZMQ7_9EUPU|nr:unnamed protein product [Candidula unifasciata]